MALADLSMEEYLRVGAAFHPLARQRFIAHQADGDRFAHYTSADAAVHMIRGAQVWMRRASLMNDFSELEYGMARLEAAKLTRAWTALRTALDGARPGVSDAIEAALPTVIASARSATYLTALCQHTAEENDLGRLSMWRAYGGQVGVCLVLNPGVLLRPSQALQVFNHPVEYLDDTGFQAFILRTAGAVLGEIELLRRLRRGELLSFAMNALRDAVLCTKHPGFREEREWRLIHSPLLSPSPRVPCEVRTIDDVPQTIHLIPLRDLPGEGLYGLAPATLVERIIVGPCRHPEPVREAMVRTLQMAGAADAEARVVVSEIPLRR